MSRPRSIRIRHLALVLLPLVACGAPEVALEAESIDVGQKNESLSESEMALSEARKQALVASYRDLTSSAYARENEVERLAPDAAVAVLDVSGAFESARMPQQRELWIPAGTVSQPKDPNLAPEFYVVFHSQDASTIYGPFEVRGQEGARCGHQDGKPLPKCLEILTCVSAGDADEPGVCLPS